MSDLIAKKKSKKTTEVRDRKTEDEKARDKALRDSKPQRSMGGQGANTLFRRKTDQDKRKRRNKRQRSVPRGNTKHKKDLRDRAASPSRVASMYLLARRTNELIRLLYKNLGDFGGTDPILDSWILEVKGPYDAMQKIVPTLKKYKFRWDPARKSYIIKATNYLYNNRKRQNFWNWARRQQKAAWPVLRDMVKEINAQLEAEDRAESPLPTDAKGWAKEFDQDKRLHKRLESMGIRVERDSHNPYSVDEPMVWLIGDTVPFKDLLKSYGFRWGRSRDHGRGWGIPIREFNAIDRDLVADMMVGL